VTLLKSVLEVVPIYWYNISDIHKCVLETIINKCFKFLGTCKIEKYVIPLVKCQSLAKSKEVGGCRLRNIQFFSQALATKSLWRLISKDDLWS
jgi:hypothetical protein